MEFNYVVALFVALSYSWWVERNWAKAQREGGIDKVAAWAALGLAALGYAEAFLSLAAPVANLLGLIDFRYAMGAVNALFVVSKPFMALFALVLVVRDFGELSWEKLAQLLYDAVVFLANALQYQRWLDTLPVVLLDFWYQPGPYLPGGMVLFLLSLLVGYGLAKSTGQILVKLFQR